MSSWVHVAPLLALVVACTSAPPPGADNRPDRSAGPGDPTSGSPSTDRGPGEEGPVGVVAIDLQQVFFDTAGKRNPKADVSSRMARSAHLFELAGSHHVPLFLTFEASKTGEVRHVFKAPTATLDELEVHISTLNPGETPHPPHKHPDEELLFVKEGTVESLVNGEAQRLGPGGVVFQAANQLHGLRNVGTTPAIYFVVKWNSPGMLKAR